MSSGIFRHVKIFFGFNELAGLRRALLVLISGRSTRLRCRFGDDV